MAKSPPAKGSPDDKRRKVIRVRIAIFALGVVALGLVVLLTGNDDSNNSSEPVTAPTSAKIVTPAELSSIAASSPTPIYWAGERPDAELELTEEEGGNFRLRYLEDGAKPGSDPAAFLTIGTYPLEDPEGALDDVAAEPGAIVRKAEDGRRVVSNEGNPNSVYFASSDNDVQIEVYDASAAVAMELALSGEVQAAH